MIKILGTVLGYYYVQAKIAQLRYELRPQLEAQDRAMKQAEKTKTPVDDGYGNRWYPPRSDGIPIVGISN